MVSGVCRRILGNADDADDAAQATFLVLATKANSLAIRSTLGDWLHGVARRTALNARRSAARRREMEKRIVRPAGQGTSDVADMLPILDEELARLPEKYRLPDRPVRFGRPIAQDGGQQLRWPEGTVAGRLARAMQLLAQRLTKRGVSLTAAPWRRRFLEIGDGECFARGGPGRRGGCPIHGEWFIGRNRVSFRRRFLPSLKEF